MPQATVLCAIDVDPTSGRGDDARADDRGPFMGPLAEATLRAADDEARRRGAALALLHALPLEGGVPMSPAGVEQSLLTRERLTQVISDGLTQAAERLCARPSADLTLLIDDGPADELIVRSAEQLGAALVVLGHAGARARRSLLLGSVATAVVERAPCSVLVVRHRTT